jgi:NTP pyrophosphatase (non-canonical NTP hydrolase)
MLKLTDDELWLIRDALSARIDSDNFYSYDETFDKDTYDGFLAQETQELFDKLLEDFAKC